MLRKSLQKAAALGARAFRLPGSLSWQLAASKRVGTSSQGLAFSKDNKKEEDEDDDVDEEFRNRSFKEEFQNFWKDPRKRAGLAAGLLLLGLVGASSEKLRDIYGLDFGFYKRITLAVASSNQELEGLVRRRQAASFKIVRTAGNFEDRFQVVVRQTDGRKSVLEVPNADSFLNFVADLQNNEGVTESSHVPVHLESRLALTKNVGLWLQATDRLLMMAIFVVTIVRLRSLFNLMRAGTNRQRRLG